MMRVKNHHMPATILVEIALVMVWGNSKGDGQSDSENMKFKLVLYDAQEVHF